MFLVVTGTVHGYDRTLATWVRRDPVPAFDFQNPSAGKVNPERLILPRERADLFHRAGRTKLRVTETQHSRISTDHVNPRRSMESGSGRGDRGSGSRRLGISGERGRRRASKHGSAGSQRARALPPFWDRPDRHL